MLLRALFISCLLFSLSAFCEENPKTTAPADKFDDQFIGRIPSKLFWSYGIGSSESQNLNLDSDLPFFLGSRLNLGITGTWGKSETGYVQTNNTRVGVSTDPFSTFGANVGYERWGQSSVIETETFKGGISLSPDSFFVSLDGEYRTISWLAQELGSGPDRLFASSTGVGGRIACSIIKWLRLSVSGMAWGYNNMPESFDDLAIAGFITEPSLNQSSGFLHWYTQGELSVNFADWKVAGKYDRAVSKLDDAIFHTFTLKGDYSPFLGWSYGLMGSWSREQDFDVPANYYGELNFGYSWQ